MRGQFCIGGKGSEYSDEMNLTISPIIEVYDCSKDTIQNTKRQDSSAFITND